MGMTEITTDNTQNVGLGDVLVKLRGALDKERCRISAVDGDFLTGNAGCCASNRVCSRTWFVKL